MRAQMRRVGTARNRAVDAKQKPASVQRAKPLRERPAERGRQVVRQLTLLRALDSARRGLTVAELHELVADGCTLRTVYRDLDHLSQAGFPLEEVAGRWSLIRASNGAALQAFALRQDEALALMLSGDLLEPLQAGGVGATHAQLRRRLLAALTPEGRQLVAEQRSSLLATHAASVDLEQAGPVLNEIDEALACEQCLQITYAAPKKPVSERLVEPHLFWVFAGRPYLVAYCRTSGEFRSFALQRIRAAKMVDEVFERRQDFDSAQFVARGFGVLHGEQHDFVVEFSAEVAHLARERRWHSSQAVEERADGSAVLRMRAAGLAEVAAWIASFGGKVRAVEPEVLRAAVCELHEAGLRAHSAGVRGREGAGRGTRGEECLRRSESGGGGTDFDL